MERPQKEMIFKSDNSTVFKYFSPKYQKTICKKVLKTKNRSKMLRFQQEIEFLSKLKDNQNVITLLDYKTKDVRGELILKIYTEYYENENLLIYTKKLKSQGETFSLQIRKFIKTFVDFFAYLQSQHISHRDIKPENIFITKDGQMKIGDFGCSVWITDQIFYTIQGSPYFLSPELREGYMLYLKRTGGIKIKHCPYKSDVFSLGLVFLSMATMEIISSEFVQIEELEYTIQDWLGKVPDRDIAEIISLMLVVNSKNRPDFIELKKNIDLKNQWCLVCANRRKNSICVCENCEKWVHLECIRSDFCEYCSMGLKICCQSCGDLCERGSCGHLFCMVCRVKNLECFICAFPPEVVRGCLTADLPKVYVCKKDKVQMDLLPSSQAYRCGKCKSTYCSICKQLAHGRDPCGYRSNSIEVVCVCIRKVKIREINLLFFNCERCLFRCIVCLKSLEADHSVCANLLNASI